MSKCRSIRRWFQFGILDVLLLTTFVAVLTLLCQPAETKSCKALPPIVGRWDSEGSMLLLFPDGSYFAYREFEEGSCGVGWTVRRVGTEKYSFPLDCGDERFVVREESDGLTIDWLNRDGSTLFRLSQTERYGGPVRYGRPHGTWTEVFDGDLAAASASLEYDNGDLVDAHRRDGSRDWWTLETVRSIRGLPTLTDRDFSDERTAEDERRE